MKRILKVEFCRVFNDWKFYSVILVGCIMAILAFFNTPGWIIARNWFKYMNGDATAALIIDKVNMVDTPLEIWMPRYGSSSLFYTTWLTILPILTVIPFGATYVEEKKKGLINQFVIRVSKKQYYLSKFIVTFISGGIVAIAPLITNLLLVMCFLTWGTPIKSSGLYPIVDGNVFELLFYEKPVIYVLIYLLYFFCIYGLISALALTFTYLEENVFAIMVTPFILYFSEHVLFEFGINLSNSSLLSLGNLYNVFNYNVKYLIIQFFVLLIIDASFLLRIKKDVI